MAQSLTVCDEARLEADVALLEAHTPAHGAIYAAGLVRTHRADLAAAIRHRVRAGSRARTAEELFAELLVERGLARVLEDDEWAAQLDERIARYEAFFLDRERSIALALLR